MNQKWIRVYFFIASYFARMSLFHPKTEPNIIYQTRTKTTEDYHAVLYIMGCSISSPWYNHEFWSSSNMDVDISVVIFRAHTLNTLHLTAGFLPAGSRRVCVHRYQKQRSRSICGPLFPNVCDRCTQTLTMLHIRCVWVV